MSVRPLRLLFLKEQMAWPRASGHDVHTFYMMQALARQGHAIALATIDEPNPEALKNCGLERHYSFANEKKIDPSIRINLSKWEEKFRTYWGIDEAAIRWLGNCAAEFRADAVIVSGLRVLPYLGALPTGTKSIWYAADEWVRHHLSQVKLLQPSTWRELKQAIHKGLYERAYRKRLDRVWVVSEADARAFRWFAGVKTIDVLPNGVDADYYSPGDETQIPNSCVFWGRLDFGPNIQALDWFLTRVWPRVLSACPTARFDVFGFAPTPQVVARCGVAGVSLTVDLPDLRAEIRRRQVVVLPFTSGGGIKNKLLEAAALGKAVLATPRVTAGLKGAPRLSPAVLEMPSATTGLEGGPPIPTANYDVGFAVALLELFDDAARRELLGRAGRAWVTEHHTWDAAARTAADGIRSIVDEKR